MNKKQKTIFSLVVDPSIEDLPVRVMVDILSRLPVKKIVQCKCVCKKWLNIVLDPCFADIHLSRSSPTGFMAKEWIDFKKTRFLKWVEVEDELDHHNLLHDPVMRLDLKLVPTLKKSPIRPVGSVDGLLCLVSRSIDNTYICNLITREYAILPKPQYSNKASKDIAYCFGVGSVTREYKVIRIFQKFKKSEVEVYTLGTGQWRSLGDDVPYWIHQLNGTFLKGHAHWTLHFKNPPDPLYAFDFDKETFELFPSPPYEEARKNRMAGRLAVLNGCLCRCDSYHSNLTVWVMKEYGIKNSWHKDLVIEYSTIPDRNMADLDWFGLKPWYPIQGYKDGTILMGTNGGKLVIYCPRRNTIAETGIRDHDDSALAYRPSFHRLHNFINERVHAFGRS